jgi:hypothetical protein
MTPDEMELAKSILSGLKNATGYGYDVLISGTVLKNELDLIATAVWLIASVIFIKITYKRWKIGENDDALPGYIGFLFIVLVIMAFLISIIEGLIFGMIAPQYVAMDRIIGLMAAKT